MKLVFNVIGSGIGSGRGTEEAAMGVGGAAAAKTSNHVPLCTKGLVAWVAIAAAASPTTNALPRSHFSLRNHGGLAASLLAAILVPSKAPREREHELFAHAQPAGGADGPPPHAAPEVAADMEQIFSDLNALNMSVMCAREDAAQANSTANEALATCARNQEDIFNVNETATCAKREALEAKGDAAQANATANSAHAKAGKALDRAGTNSANIQKVNSTANEALGKADDNEDKIEEVNATAVCAKDDVAIVNATANEALATCPPNEADIFGVNETAVCAKREALEAKAKVDQNSADITLVNGTANDAMSEAVNASNAAAQASDDCKQLVCSLAQDLFLVSPTERIFSTYRSCFPGCFFYDGTTGDDLTAQCSAASEVNCCSGIIPEFCLDATGIVCRDSCIGFRSCEYFQGIAMKGSCIGLEACHGKEGFVGEGGCSSTQSCAGHTGSVGRQSCQGDWACQDGVFDAEDESCQGDGSCVARGDGTKRVGNVHAKACHGWYACAKSTAVIKSNACTAPCSCWGNTTDVIEEGTCTEACECANREDVDFDNWCVQRGPQCA